MAFLSQNESVVIPGSSRVEYQLAKRATLEDLKAGRILIKDVCDAHPELLRVARNVGVRSTAECPICEEKAQLVVVTFAFGKKLPAGGRCITQTKELEHLALNSGIKLYEVEVCLECSWNYLIRVHSI
jgi:hypothetical protein